MRKKRTTKSLLLLKTKLESQKRSEVPGSLKYRGGNIKKEKGQAKNRK